MDGYMDEKNHETTYAESGGGRMACPFNGNACTDRCPLLLFDDKLEGACAIAALAVSADAIARRGKSAFSRTPMRPR